MFHDKRIPLLCMFLLISILIVAGSINQAQSQEKYPTRAIDIIVPYGPGGATDLNIRVLAIYMKKKLGVPINIINKPGGNTVPGSLEAQNAVPDGYTLLADNVGSGSMVKTAVKDLPFNILDRTFIGMYSGAPLLILVPTASPYKSVKDLEVEAKRDPGSFTWTSLGGAGVHDFGGRQFLKAIGVDVLKTKPIIGRSGADAATLVAGGNVKMGLGAISSTISIIKAGYARPLAIASKARFPDLPDVPTTAEVGYPSIIALHWNGISGPPNLPSHVVNIWDKALQEAVKDPDVIAQLRNIGAVPFYHNASATRNYVKKEIEELEILWNLK